MTGLALFYEHPEWLKPLFAELDRRCADYLAIAADGHAFDPAGSPPPAPLIFNRVAMSSFLRAPDHPVFYAQALFAHWAAAGARIVNGGGVMAVDASKARQLSLIAGLGFAVPATRIVHRRADIVAAAADLRFPLVVKPNIGGSGTGIVRFDSMAQLTGAAADGMLPDSVDRVWLVQDYVPARGGAITRIETMGGRFLYALDIAGGGEFDLCPADVCLAGKPSIEVRRADPPPALIAAAERIAAAAGMDVGGVEVMIDDRDGTPRFYDINAFSNFVANPLDVLGWDPHVRLVDWLETMMHEGA